MIHPPAVRRGFLNSALHWCLDLALETNASDAPSPTSTFDYRDASRPDQRFLRMPGENLEFNNGCKTDVTGHISGDRL